MMMRRLLNDRRGGTAIEYGMIASLITFLIITSLVGMGASVEQMFSGLLPAFAAAP